MERKLKHTRNRGRRSTHTSLHFLLISGQNNCTYYSWRLQLHPHQVTRVGTNEIRRFVVGRYKFKLNAIPEQYEMSSLPPKPRSDMGQAKRILNDVQGTATYSAHIIVLAAASFFSSSNMRRRICDGAADNDTLRGWSLKTDNPFTRGASGWSLGRSVSEPNVTTTAICPH